MQMKKWFTTLSCLFLLFQQINGQNNLAIPPGITPPAATPVSVQSKGIPAPIPGISPNELEHIDLPATGRDALTLEKATLLLPGMDTPKEFTLQIRDGVVFIADDIALFKESDFRLKKQEKGGVIPYQYSRWPNGQIPYVVSSSHPSYSQIIAAIDYVNATTNLCLFPRTNEVDYVQFTNNDANSCWSYVGRIGGAQYINVDNCGVGSTVHEICHAAGMWHEQSRNDRDTYVTVLSANILSGYESNFDIYGSSGNDIGTYDYGSIMHYPKYAFSRNGQPTITVNVPPGSSSTVIGQRSTLSAADVATLNGMYTQKNCNATNTDPVIDLYAAITPNPSPIVIGQTASVTTNFLNSGGGPFVGCYYLALINQNQQFVSFLSSAQESAGLAAGYRYSNNLTFNIPAQSITPGNYFLAFFYSINCSTDYFLVGSGSFANPIPISFVYPVNPELAVSPSQLSFGPDAASQSCTITSNVPWTVQTGESWISAGISAGNNNGTVSISCLANPAIFPRSGTITITGGGITRQITVSQSGAVPFLNASPSSLAFTGTVSSQSISVNSNTYWTVSSANPWVSVSPSSGTGNGTVTITCSTNTGFISRSGTVTVSSSGLPDKTVQISQEGADRPLSTSPAGLNFSEFGGAQTIILTSFVDWTASPVDPWLAVSPLSGGPGTHVLTVTSTPSTTVATRYGKVSLRGTYNSSYDILVIQEGQAPFLDVSETAINFQSLGENRTFRIQSNTTWRVSESLSWLSVSPVEGSGNAEITVTALPKTGSTSRYGNIYVYASGTASKRIAITQEGNNFNLSVQPTELPSFSAAGGTASVSLNSNTSWNVTAPEWLSISPTSGSGSTYLQVTAAPNPTISPRSGLVQVSGSGVADRTVLVTQQGQLPYLLTERDTVLLPKDAGSAILNLSSNTTWTLTENATWLSASPISGSGNGSITFTATENASYDPRSTLVAIQAPGLPVRNIVLLQAAQPRILSVTPPQTTFTAAGGNKQVVVSALQAWQATTSEGWITLSSYQGSNGTFNIVVACTPNTAITSRSATATFTTEGTVPVTLTITQEAAEAYMSPAKSTMNFAGIGGTLALRINSNTSWRTSEFLSWASITPASGAGDGQILITVNPRVATSARSGVIYLYATNVAAQKVTINQAGVGQGAELSTSVETIAFNATGGTQSLAVLSNIAWSAQATDSWLSVSPASGSGDETLTITCTRNFIPVSRSAEIRLSEPGGLSAIVRVTQEGSPDDASLTVSPSALAFPDTGNEQAIQINSNTSWTIHSVPSWLHPNKTTGILQAQVMLRADRNPGTQPRMAILGIKGFGVDTQWVTITQSAALPTLALQPDTLFFPWTGATQAISVASNTGWIINPPSEDWFTLSALSGSGNSNISVAVTRNLDATPRSYLLTFQSTEGNLQRTTVLTQYGKPAIQVPTGWAIQPTAIDHTVLLPAGLQSSIEGASLSIGDLIGVFFEKNGTTVCAGYGEWLEDNSSFPVFGDNPETSEKEGLSEDEAFLVKVYRQANTTTYDVEASYLQPSDENIVSAEGAFQTDGISMILGLNAFVPDSQTLYLTSGWNTVSTYILPKKDLLQEIQIHPLPFILQIKNGADQTFSLTPPVNEIGTWNKTEGYRIQTSAAGNIKVYGKAIDPLNTPIPIQPGWQIIPFFSRTDKPIVSALSSIRATIIMVKDNAGKVYAPAYGLNTIKTMRPGQGYLLNARTERTLIYPADYMATPADALSAEASNSLAEERPLFYPAHSDQPTGSDATLILLADELQAVLQPGDELAVLDSDQKVRAATRITGKNQAIVLRGEDTALPGKQGFFLHEPFLFRVWKSNEQKEYQYLLRATDHTAAYIPHTTIFLEAGLLQPLEQEAPVGLRVFPNPASESATIRIPASPANRTVLRILDAHGKTMQEKIIQEAFSDAQILTLSLTDLPEGLYMVHIIQDGVLQTQKLTVVRP